jgi:hypothetical protein
MLLLLLVSSTALASVVEPYPGMKLVRTAQSAMVITSLCAPGISVRATKYAERKATPQQWAESIGAQAAINVDFFDFPGWTLVNGRARGGGEDWPADKQFFESRSYWQFGLFVSDLVQNAQVAPVGIPWVTEVVAGHNILIRDGVSLGPSFDGDGVILSAHRRSAIGLSKDRRTLFMLSTNKILDGNGLVAELRALQQEGGAPAIDVATNVDGGGSSQLYVRGFGQVITSGRQVNNHLGVFAGGSGPSYNCTNIPPRGTLDAAECSGVRGWAQDGNVPKDPIDVHLYFGGPAGSPAPGKSYRAADTRADLCAPLGSCEHAFNPEPPRSLLDGKPHPIHAYAIDTEGGRNPELDASPKSFVCAEQPPAGRLRHVLNPEVFAGWKFTMFDDVQPLTEAQLAAYPLGAPFASLPKMVRGTGTPRVYVVDEGFRRPVADPPTAARWHLDLSMVTELPLSELDAIPLGPPLRRRPFLVQGAGPAIYLVDDVLPDVVREVAAEISGGPVTLAAKGMQPGGATSPGRDMNAVGGCAVSPGGLLGLAILLAAVRRRRVS